MDLQDFVLNPKAYLLGLIAEGYDESNRVLPALLDELTDETVRSVLEHLEHHPSHYDSSYTE